MFSRWGEFDISELEFETKKKWLGTRMKRVEDRRLLAGSANFVDDLKMKGVLHVAILRSPRAHAKISHIDTRKAFEMREVVVSLTGEDAHSSSKPLPPHEFTQIQSESEEYCLAFGKVRYVGEPVVAIAATDLKIAEDALEEIDVDYQPLPAIVDVEKALSPEAPLVYESFGTNSVSHFHDVHGDPDYAFDVEADRIIRNRISLHRYSSTPLETAAVTAQYNRVSGKITIWCNAHFPGMLIPTLSTLLGIPSNKIHLIIQDIGGGFGIKSAILKPLLITCLLAMKVNDGKPVKYVEQRTEHLLAAGQSANCVAYIEAAVKKDGRILALRLRDLNNDGASPNFAGMHASRHNGFLTGCYDIRNTQCDSYSILTNTCPSAANRGIGKPGIVYIVEKMIDVIAGELKIDPAEVRFRNFVQPNQFPYTNAGGYVYDSGNYPEMLKKALHLAEYDSWRKKQQALWHDGKFIGIGISAYVHGASGNQRDVEGVSIRIDPLGNLIVRSGSPDMGTSHATAICQVLAEELGVNPNNVKVLPFDSDYSPWTLYSGTRSNRFSGAELESLLLGAGRLKTKVCKIAGHVLAAPADRIALSDGRAILLDDPERFVTLSNIAKMSYSDPDVLALGLNLEETAIAGGFRAGQTLGKYSEQPKGSRASPTGLTRGYVTYPSSAHVAIVEVDTEIGVIRILKYIIVHDVGRVINPMIVEGQVHGGAAHGIAAALMEGFSYDDEGQLLTT
ncbi:MAG: xanthine dehydrogenase family protein molybdopterin-binding subunit, partial [Thaumarchaeota archaeon]|nr:xanthine dehydrogenase family protein molybdopterin-binding subunit [Nitrososphaerota archaeon]